VSGRRRRPLEATPTVYRFVVTVKRIETVVWAPVDCITVAGKTAPAHVGPSPCPR